VAAMTIHTVGALEAPPLIELSAGPATPAGGSMSPPLNSGLFAAGLPSSSSTLSFLLAAQVLLCTLPGLGGGSPDEASTCLGHK